MTEVFKQLEKIGKNSIRLHVYSNRMFISNRLLTIEKLQHVNCKKMSYFHDKRAHEKCIQRSFLCSFSDNKLS